MAVGGPASAPAPSRMDHPDLAGSRPARSWKGAHYTALAWPCKPLGRAGRACYSSRPVLPEAARMMVQAWVFPGQGSQAVGMGKALNDAFPVARELFQEVDEALQQRLSRIMWEGPEADLTLTENAQPALLAVSLAAVRVVEGETGRRIEAFARYAAGHSLGEYSALTAARAL